MQLMRLHLFAQRLYKLQDIIPVTIQGVDIRKRWKQQPNHPDW